MKVYLYNNFKDITSLSFYSCMKVDVPPVYNNTVNDIGYSTFLYELTPIQKKKVEKYLLKKIQDIF